MAQSRSNEPFWWALFSAGMAIGAFVVPALIVITGLLIPLGLLGGADQVRQLIAHPLTRAFLFVVISFSFFHWAHRFRFVLIDLGLSGARNLLAVLCYGTAIALSLVTAWIALAPLWSPSVTPGVAY